MAKLRPRARIIRTIGDRLISGPEAAIIELVKNAYDADSKTVHLKIEPPALGKLGLVVVSDSGCGMTYENIINNWLEPATDFKSLNKISPSGKRSVLGAKGVGRFASASLGKRTTITSIAKVEELYEKSEFTIDWDDFLSAKYLDDIDLKVTSEYIDNPTDTGVSIVIQELSTVWDEKKLQKLIKELRRLAKPNSEDEFNIHLDLDLFNKSLPAPYNFSGLELLKSKNRDIFSEQQQTDYSKIIPYATNSESDYLLKGKFDSQGKFVGDFSIVRGDNISQKMCIDSPKIESGELECGEIDIDLRICDLEKESIEKLFSRMGLKFEDWGLRKAREFIAENTGIAIYRSGFRIRPYGEPDNDWLQLEKRRVQQPSKKIGHGQVSGVITVRSEEISNLIERSSREGLENNGAFERLKNLVLNVLTIVEQKRQSFREGAGISRKPEGDLGKAREIASLESITRMVQELPIESQKPLLLKIESESKALTKVLDEIEAYQRLLASRAALGMVVAQVIHDGSSYLSPIINNSSQMIKNLPHLMENSQKGEIIRKNYPSYALGIKESAQRMGSLFRSLDPISGRRRGRPENFSIKETVNDTLSLLSDPLIENGIETFNEIDEDEMCYGFQGDMQSTLMNIISNAIHWLSVREQEHKNIRLWSTEEETTVSIFISNNGPNIDDNDSNKIFDAGFSLKSQGHGLGLSIAREACRASNGELFLFQTYPETTFKIQFPKSNGAEQ